MKKCCKSLLLLSIPVFFGLFAPFVGAATDSSQYIPIDEIQPGMEAYCLSVFAGMEIERFELKLLSVVRGVEPGQDMILVIGTDERFQHAGTVHGCSGSPVFIDGRLAGALAAGWDGSLDSLYLVRPIHNMLEVGSVETTTKAAAQMAFHYDLSGPLDLAEIERQTLTQLENRSSEQRMLLPLVSSLPSAACESLAGSLEKMGFIPVSSVGMMPSAKDAGVLERGGTLAIPLCSGDISMAATGTVTEVAGRQVYGFGHSFTGQGPVEFPMSAGLVHAVVAGRGRSFKLATPGPVLGTLEFDQASAVRGTIGKMPELIPLTIGVKRFNDPKERIYNCQLAKDRVYTPMIARGACNGAALMQGPLPSEHTLSYRGAIRVKDRGVITFENISSGQSTMEVSRVISSTLSLLLNNSFEPMEVESVEVNMDIQPETRLANIWSVDVSKTEVKAGEKIFAAVALKMFREEAGTVKIGFDVPADLAPGKYKLQIMGGADYQRFVSQAAPQRFRVFDAETLMEGLQRVNSFRNDRLCAVMAVPASGIVMRQHELAQLPQTKMLLMQDTKRLAPVSAYRDWTASEMPLDSIVQGMAEIEITVVQ